MKKKIVIGLILVLALIIGGVVFYVFGMPQGSNLTDSQKEEALTKLLGRKVSLKQKAIPTGNTEYKGKYITFSYPKKASVYDYIDSGFSSSSARLESFSFDIKQPRTIFSMAVLDSGSSVKSVDDYPAVITRQNSGSYKKTSVVVDGFAGKVYERQDSRQSEKTAFFLVKNRLYSLAVLCNDYDEMQIIFDGIINSVKFTDLKSTK